MKALLKPLGFGLVAVGSAFFAGLSYFNIWIALLNLVADVLIIWFIIKMSRSVGIIETLEAYGPPPNTSLYPLKGSD